jgi:hypothetical protein
MQNPFKKKNITVRCEKCGCFYDSVLGHNPAICRIVKETAPKIQETLGFTAKEIIGAKVND